MGLVTITPPTFKAGSIDPERTGWVSHPNIGPMNIKPTNKTTTIASMNVPTHSRTFMNFFKVHLLFFKKFLSSDIILNNNKISKKCQEPFPVALIVDFWGLIGVFGYLQ